jgi:hypothetical protein
VKGEVIIIASGGFGTATIQKSLTVDVAPGVLAFDAQQINVYIGPSDIVTLRGLTINGAIFGASAGVYFHAGGTLNLENCDIGFATYGIIQDIAGNLNIKGCAFHDTGYGIYCAPDAGNAKLAIANSSIRNTTNGGLYVSESTAASVTDSQFANNVTAIGATSVITAAKAIVSVNNCMISGSSATALMAYGSNSGIATIYVTNTSINSNNNTLTVSTSTGGVASVVSFGNNTVGNNTTTTPFSSTVPTT